ncbi:MAG: hypothetical protein K6G83_12370 [Lachnospiraceae bacterium]|nr:hypothetical protein [Lachnospiraceae bacterium]
MNLKILLRGTLFAGIITICGLFSKPVYAVDYDSSSSVLDGTLRMMSGAPVTLNEQLGLAAPVTSTPVTSGGTGYIIIGDSNTVAMNLHCHVNDTPDSWFVIACAGVHADYIPNVVIPAAKQLQNAHPEIGRWKYIVNLGLTDLHSQKNFINTLTSFASGGREVYFVSVNPTNPSNVTSTYKMTNNYIEPFNAQIAQLPGIHYIDTYNPLMQSGYGTADDGFHYDPATLSRIYSIIKAGVLS